MPAGNVAARLEGKDRDLVVKCLGMTTSDQDGEALSAIRQANRVLKRLGLTWQEVMAAPTATAAGFYRTANPPGRGDPVRHPFTDDFSDAMDRWQRQQKARREAQARAGSFDEQMRQAEAASAQEAAVKRAATQALFEMVLASQRLPTLKRDYFQSMKDQWDRSGHISVAQEQALKRAYALYA